MSYLQLVSWFKSLPTFRRVSLCLSLVFILLVTAGLICMVFTPTYALLFGRLDAEDANRIINQLEQEHIAYRIQNNGGDILIEKSLVEKTRLKLMGSSVSFNNNLGFELFDKSDFGMTDFSQKINYQRALQGELERTIKSIEEIQQARVHLVIPQSHLFEQDNNKPKAAVNLHLKKSLSSKQVRSIQQLIAASVANLELKNVVLVDQHGKMLSDSEDDSKTSHLSTKKAIEHYLSDKAMQLLHSIYPEQKVIVKIDATVNYDELQRELIKPQSHGLITHEKEIKHATIGKNEKEKNNQDSTIEKSYQFGQEKESYKRASGYVEKISISVILPQTANQNTLEQVEALVKTALGFDAKRGDSISVAALIKQDTQIMLAEVTPIFKSEPTKPFFYLAPLFGLVFLGLSSGLYLKRLRHQRRQILLAELTQWLSSHE